MSSRPGPGDSNEALTAVTVSVLLISVCILMFQILQSVTLSLQVFHTTAFLVISVSLFGGYITRVL